MHVVVLPTATVYSQGGSAAVLGVLVVEICVKNIWSTRTCSGATIYSDLLRG